MIHPLQVGITGGIGAGKSLVSKIFQCLGVPVYDADSRAKGIMATDLELVALIKSEFGASSYQLDGTLNREFLAKATFGNPQRLDKLNSLVHPRVAADHGEWVKKQQHHPYLLREAALLYEAGVYTSIDKMIVVTAPLDVRIQRVLRRDGHRTEQDIRAIIKRQWPEEEKIKRADFIIYNDDSQMVIPQVLSLHHELVSLGQ